MTGKTLTISDLMKPVQPVQAQPGIITVPATPQEDEDIDLLTLLEKINAFVNNVNRLTENVKELINNLAMNADKLMLPPGIAEKLQLFQSVNQKNPPTQLVPQQIDVNAILRTFEQLPDDMPVGELKKLVKSVLGDRHAGAGENLPEGQEG